MKDVYEIITTNLILDCVNDGVNKDNSRGLTGTTKWSRDFGESELIR